LKVLLKYTGSKWKLAPWIIENIGRQDDLVEVFCGGASLSFTVRPERGWLNDIKDWALIVFSWTKQDPKGVWEALKLFSDQLYQVDKETSKAQYLALRSSYEDMIGPESAAARIALSTCGFNGLTRFDRGGRWNVAYGNRFFPGAASSGFPFIRQYSYDVIKYYSDLLKNFEITNLDFEEVIDSVEPNSFVYCDPPYISSPDVYVGWDTDQAIRLRRALDRFSSRGGRFAVSEMSVRDGVPVEGLREIWDGYRFIEHDYSYSIGSGKPMVGCKEALIVNS
jgi:DNA adenine methylase Dam